MTKPGIWFRSQSLYEKEMSWSGSKVNNTEKIKLSCLIINCDFFLDMFLCFSVSNFCHTKYLFSFLQGQNIIQSHFNVGCLIGTEPFEEQRQKLLISISIHFQKNLRYWIINPALSLFKWEGRYSLDRKPVITKLIHFTLVRKPEKHYLLYQSGPCPDWNEHNQTSVISTTSIFCWLIVN